MPEKRSLVPGSTTGQGEILPNVSPLERALPARNPITRSRGKFRVMVPAPGLNRMIKCESILERNAVLHFRFSPAVNRIDEQPCRIHYYIKATQKTYTPDFALKLANGKTLYVEVKPLLTAETHEWKEKLRAIQDKFESDGRTWVLVTDKEVNHRDRLVNLCRMRMFARKKLSAPQLKALQLVLRDVEKLSVSQAIASGLVSHISDIYALLANYHICTDLSSLITNDSVISLPRGNQHESLIFAYRTIN